MHQSSVRSFACAAVLFASSDHHRCRRSRHRNRRGSVGQGAAARARHAGRCRRSHGRHAPSPILTARSVWPPSRRPGAGSRSPLAGFQAASAACGAGSSAIGLAVAPIQEAIVVSATRTEAPLAQLASSATVIRRGGDRAASAAAADRPPARHAGRRGGGQRHARRGRVAVPARRREQLHEGAARRHPAERAGRHVRLRQRHAPRTSSASRSCGAHSPRCSARTRWPASSSCSRPARPARPAAARLVEGGSFGTVARVGRRGRQGRRVRLLGRRRRAT